MRVRTISGGPWVKRQGAMLVLAAAFAASVSAARAEETAAGPDQAAETLDAAAAKARPKSRFVFAANTADGEGIWITDGTPNGTKRLANVASNWVSRLKKGVVLFSSGELWITDGTPKGTKLLKEIEPGPTGSNIGWLEPVGDGRAMFKADTSANGGELWVTDGTPKGTKLVKDIFPGFYDDPWVGKRANSGTPWEITALGDGRVIFGGQDLSNNVEPWISDGTAEGTRKLREINPTGRSGASEFVTLGDGNVTFYASDGVNGGELYVTDGTPKGTRLLKDINPDGSASIGSLHFGEQVRLKKGRSVFSAFTPNEGNELWATDGTPAGTRLVKDIFPGLDTSDDPNASNPQNMVAMGDGRALFAARDPNKGFELFITDGSAKGTKLVKDVNPGTGSSGPHGFAPLGKGRFVFAATHVNSGRELWVTDGTSKGTKLVKDIAPGTAHALGSSLSWTASLGDGRVLFPANDGKSGEELWVTDGTSKGTKLLKDIHKGPDSSAGLVDASGVHPARLNASIARKLNGRRAG